MNWYSKTQIKKHIHKLFISKKTIKTASALESDNTGTVSKLGPTVSSELDWKQQAEDTLEFGNFQRYVCDSQTIKVFLTKTNTKLAVSLITNHTYLGTAGWSIFWALDLNEKKEAEELFKKVAYIARETTEEFIREEKPTVLLHIVLRQKFKDLERHDVVRTNNPIINYSYDIPYETDWRKTIYGPRYPTYKEESFEKYLNSSIYSKNNAPVGKFAL